MLRHHGDAYHARVYQAERCYGSPIRDNIEWLYRLLICLGDKHLSLLGTVSDAGSLEDAPLIPSAEDHLLS